MKAVTVKDVANESFKNLSSQFSDSRLSTLSDTLQSLSVGTFEDAGKMSRKELHNETRSTNNSFYRDPSKDTFKNETMQNRDSSPTSRLHKLLQESRHMMQELEHSATLSLVENSTNM